MRFIPKFNNGYWKLFDTVQYRDVEIFALKSDLDAAVIEANAQANSPKQVRR